MQGAAGKLDGLDDPAEMATLLEELQCLMELLDPQLREPAHELAERPSGDPVKAG
jgi:hypothetical protein